MILLLLSALCVCPVVGSSSKVKHSETFDDFHLQMMIDPLEEWKDSHTCDLFRPCVKDDNCWNSLSDSNKDKTRSCYHTIFETLKKSNSNQIDHDEWRKEYCQKKKCDLKGKGWIDNLVVLAGRLVIESEEEGEIFHAVMKYKPRMFTTYNRTFSLEPKEQHQHVLFDRTINTQKATEAEKQFVELIKNIFEKKKDIDANNLGIAIDTTMLVIGVVTTSLKCISIPTTGPIGVMGCLSGIGAVSIDGASLVYELQSNKDLKEKIESDVNKVSDFKKHEDL